MDYQKSTNLLGNIPGKVTTFITEKCIEFHDQSGNATDRYKPNKQIRFKNQCYNQIYVITVMHILLLNNNLLLGL